MEVPRHSVVKAIDPCCEMATGPLSDATVIVRQPAKATGLRFDAMATGRLSDVTVIARRSVTATAH